MKKRQLFLYLIILVGLFDKGGILAVLPDYARRLGAPPAVIGYYLAFCFLALSAGVFGAPVLARRLTNLSPMMVVIGLIKIPVVFLHGQVTDIGQLMELNGLDWFLIGMVSVLISIIIGVRARAGERGKLFGVVTMAQPIGSMLGAVLASELLSQGGYDRLFTVLTIIAAGVAAAALFLAPMSLRAGSGSAERKDAPSQAALGRFARSFLGLALIASIALFIGNFGASIAMLAQQITPSEISLTSVLGTGSAIAIPLTVGWLSDRIGRKYLLVASYGLLALSLLLMVFSTALWQFALVVVVRAISNASSGTLGPALLTDLLPKDRLPRALSLLNTTGWLGGVVSFAAMGNAVQQFGIINSIWTGVVLIATTAVLMALLLLWRRAPSPPIAPA